MAARTFFSPLAASLASVGRRSGPKMNSAANARTTISPQPIESNTVPPPRGTHSGAAAVGVQGRSRGCPAAERRPSGGVEGGLDLAGAASAHQFDGDRVARVVGVDGDLELLGAADGLAIDGDDDVLLLDARVGGRAGRLDVDHEGAVPRAVGDRPGVDAERGVNRLPGGDQLLGDLPDGVDRDGEAEPDRAARGAVAAERGDRRVDADDRTGAVDERAAGVAG